MMMRTKKFVLVLLGVCLVFGVSAQASRLAYEDFDGTASANVDGTAGGDGWSGAWTVAAGGAGSFTFVSPGMTFTGLETSGLKATYDPTAAATTRFNRLLDSAITVDAVNTEAWASALVEIGSGAGDVNAGRGIGVELTNAGTPVVGFGKKLNSSFGVGPAMEGDGWVNSTVPANTVGVRYVVLKLARVGTDTVATVYVATDGDTIDIADPTTFTGIASITITGSVTFDGVNIYGYHASTTSNGVDEIKVGNTYDDVSLAGPGGASDPLPGSGDDDVELNVILQWTTGDNPSTTEHKVYMSNGVVTDEPNVHLVDTLPVGTTEYDPKADGTPDLTGTVDLPRDTTYYWRIDEVLGGETPAVPEPNEITGTLWNFETLKSTPDVGPVTPAMQFADIGDDPNFTVTATNPFTGDATGLDYQWYKGAVGDTGIPVGDDSSVLQFFDVQAGNDGEYWCEVTITSNSASDNSESGYLTVKRLIGHWTFDNTLDAAVGGLTATVVDPNTANAIPPVWGYGTDANSIVGSASLSLDNSDASEGGWLTVPDSNDVYNFYPRGMTVSTWIKTTVPNGSYDDIVSKNYDDGASRWFQRIAGNNGLFRMGTAGAWTNAAINDGVWHLMVTTYDPTTGITQVYLDGTARGSASMSPTSEGNLAPLTIGGTALLSDGLPDKGLGWIGFIDDVKFYTYPRTAEDIAQEYFDVTGVQSCIHDYDDPDFVLDFDGNCIIDLKDFARFAQYWLSTGLYPAL